MISLKDKKYLVVGLGVTGKALIDFLVAHHALVWVLDPLSKQAVEEICKKYPQVAQVKESFFVDCPELRLTAVLVSPGVPPTGWWFDEAKKRDIPILGELEWASRFVQGQLLTVTGTNGKSTTVTLIHCLLQAAGKKSCLKGNIGSPLITAVTEPPSDFYVIEASSYQLETVEQFHPHVAVMMNVTDDHLERYQSLQAYADAKENIGKNQTANDFFIYNDDDRYCCAMAKRSKAKKLPFSLVNQFDEGGFVFKNQLVIRVGGVESRYELRDCALQGLHNHENMLASLLTVQALGIQTGIKETLKNFKALPHRLEKVGEFNGITFYDDSKGTNVGAVVMSLASFDHGVILILGGRDKGGEYAPLKSLIEAKVKHLILLGEAKEKIYDALHEACHTTCVNSMQEAVEVSYKVGSAGDTVLLSPACSSFDMYRNYAERGEDFQKWVRDLGVKK